MGSRGNGEVSVLHYECMCLMCVVCVLVPVCTILAFCMHTHTHTHTHTHKHSVVHTCTHIHVHTHRYLMTKLFKVTFYLPNSTDEEDVRMQLTIQCGIAAFTCTP